MTRRRTLGAVALMAALLAAGPSRAVEPDEVLPDAGLEARARDVSSGLRCLVCQNQSIDDSAAPLARDLRLIVREHLKAGDTVLDIGSNDATSLKAYKTPSLNRIGIDPTGAKFRQYYPDDIKLVPDFFSAKNFDGASKARAKIVTSIAMFYDLEDPVQFARDIAHALAPDGIWHFEQSYLPSMLRLTSYDTICHEHVEYYSLQVVKDILAAADLQRLYGVADGRGYLHMSVLRGDPSDGLPGIAGIGEKSAADLLRQHGDLHAVMAAAADPSTR